MPHMGSICRAGRGGYVLLLRGLRRRAITRTVVLVILLGSGRLGVLECRLNRSPRLDGVAVGRARA